MTTCIVAVDYFLMSTLLYACLLTYMYSLKISILIVHPRVMIVLETICIVF